MPPIKAAPGRSPDLNLSRRSSAEPLLPQTPVAAPLARGVVDRSGQAGPHDGAVSPAGGVPLPLAAPSLSLRQQRIVCASMFSMFGYMFGHFASQLPVTKERLRVSDPQFGLLLLADDIGNFVAQGAASAAPHTLQSARLAPITGASTAMAAGLANASRTPNQFAPAMLTFGTVASLFDIAVNIQLVALGTASGQAEAPFFHGLFSAGQWLGSGVGALLTRAGVPFPHRVEGTSLALASVYLLHWPFVVAEAPPESTATPDADAPRQDAARRRILLCLLAGLGLLSSVGEGAASEWAGIYLRQNVHTDFATANTAALAFAGGMTAARLGGSWTAHRVGIKPVIIGGGVVAAAAMTYGLLDNRPLPFLLAVAATGVGLANITPLSMAALSDFPAHEQAAAVTKVSIAQQVGFFSGPPLIGAASGVLGLRYALGFISLTSAAIVLLACPMRLTPRARHPHAVAP